MAAATERSTLRRAVAVCQTARRQLAQQLFHNACPQHIAASGADVETDVFRNFLKQDRKMNTFDVEYDFTRKFGARIGYRFDRRDIVLSSFESSALTFYPTLPNRGACATQPATTGPCSADSNPVSSANGAKADTVG